MKVVVAVVVVHGVINFTATALMRLISFYSCFYHLSYLLEKKAGRFYGMVLYLKDTIHIMRERAERMLSQIIHANKLIDLSNNPVKIVL